MSDNEVSARTQRLLMRNQNRDQNQLDGAGPGSRDDGSGNSSRNSVSTNNNTIGTNDENVDPNVGHVGSTTTPVERENIGRGIDQASEATPVCGPTGQMMGYFFPSNQPSNQTSQASRTGNDVTSIPGPASVRHNTANLDAARNNLPRRFQEIRTPLAQTNPQPPVVNPNNYDQPMVNNHNQNQPTAQGPVQGTRPPYQQHNFPASYVNTLPTIMTRSNRIF